MELVGYSAASKSPLPAPLTQFNTPKPKRDGGNPLERPEHVKPQPQRPGGRSGTRLVPQENFGVRFDHAVVSLHCVGGAVVYLAEPEAASLRNTAPHPIYHPLLEMLCYALLG